MIRQADFTQGKVHRKRGAVFSLANDLTANADNLRLASAQVRRDVAVVLLGVRRWHQDTNIPADQFYCRIPKKLLGGRVHRLNQPSLVDGDNPLDGRFQDGPHPLLALVQRRLRNRLGTGQFACWFWIGHFRISD